MRLSAKAGLPILVLMLGVLGTVAIVSVSPTVAIRTPTRMIPLVQAIRAEPQSISLTVTAQGSVVPRTESELVAEVSGRITWASPSLASGGFFERGDALVKIDASDYEVAVERSDARLARAISELELAQRSLERVEQLALRGVASVAAVENAQSAARVAEAIHRDAKAALKQARTDLARTRVLAPFAGRVREKRVDVGQFVSRGSPVARVYAVDYAEVKLPIPDEEAAFVDLPIDYRDEFSEATSPEVSIRAHFAGREYTWQGRIVRTEGELDPRTRMIQAVARVEDPYGRGEDPSRPPLAVGLFVEAEIQGRVVENVVVIPRSALRADGRVIIIDEDDRLRLRRVEVLRRDRDRVLIRSGVAAGERICTTPLAVSVEGMRVRVASEEEEETTTQSASTRSPS